MEEEAAAVAFRKHTLLPLDVRKYHYASHEELQIHLHHFVDAYNFAKRLKTLKGLTVFEFISMKWPKEPERFIVNPDQLMPGPFG